MIRILVNEDSMGLPVLIIPNWTEADNDSLSTQCFLSDNDDELIIIMHPRDNGTTDVLATFLKFDGPLKSTKFTIDHDMSGDINLYDEIQLALNKNINMLFMF